MSQRYRPGASVLSARHPVPDGVRPVYITNELGDVVQVDVGGVIEPFDPGSWGWMNPGGKKDPAEERRSVDSLRGLPGFTVEVNEGARYLPGPKKRSATWGKFRDGGSAAGCRPI